MLKLRYGILVLTLLASVSASVSASAQVGHTDWDGWSFDWEVTDGSGLAIRNVYYNREFVLWKASLPVIRVKYDTVDGDTCGPYADRIYSGNLVPISSCGNNTVCQQGYTASGHNMLELAVYARIGSYHLYQAWYLSEDGWIGAYLWSRGLQCQIDHVHHPYWRLDFDINGYPSDQLFVYGSNRGNEGWGPGWHKYTNEANDTKNPVTSRVWFARDNPTGHGMWVLPGSNDGVVDSFSNRDASSRLYHGVEDEPWPFWTNELGYDDNEDIQEKDIILWYTAHLQHAAAGGGGQWHPSGPWLLVHR